MQPAERYAQEAPSPAEPSLHETIRYLFEETQRRAYHSTANLTDDDINADPGRGARSIGENLQHQLFLVQFILETIKPGSTRDLPEVTTHPKGSFALETMLLHRELLNDRFREVFPAIPAEDLMLTRPEMPPKGWAEWPVLMRILRPLTDLATHVGQVNYARRQLGRPVGS